MCRERVQGGDQSRALTNLCANRRTHEYQTRRSLPSAWRMGERDTTDWIGSVKGRVLSLHKKCNSSGLLKRREMRLDNRSSYSILILAEMLSDTTREAESQPSLGKSNINSSQTLSQPERLLCSGRVSKISGNLVKIFNLFWMAVGRI